MPQSSEGLIIAVVEDDPRIEELIHEEICDEGHCCRGFSTAEAFLNDVEQLNPDLVLMDLMLPGMDGLTDHGKQQPRISLSRMRGWSWRDRKE